MLFCPEGNNSDACPIIVGSVFVITLNAWTLGVPFMPNTPEVKLLTGEQRGELFSDLNERHVLPLAGECIHGLRNKPLMRFISTTLFKGEESDDVDIAL